MIGRKTFDRTLEAVRSSGAGQLVEDVLGSSQGRGDSRIAGKYQTRRCARVNQRLPPEH